MRLRQLLLIGAFVFVIAFVVFLPANSAIHFVDRPAGLSYASVSGSIWSMRFERATIFGRPLSSFEFSPSFWSLIVGEVGGSAQLENPRMRAEFDLNAADVIAVKRANLSAQIRAGSAALPLSGTLVVTDGRLDMDRSGRCLAASGAVQTDAFASLFSALGQSVPSVSGEVVCDGVTPAASFRHVFEFGSASALVQLVSATEAMVNVVLRFTDQAAMPQQLVARLEQAGFAPTGDGWEAGMRVSL